MRSDEIRKKFLEFFEKRGHTVVPSSSLIPDDPSVLLTTAGMQQFKPYYTGDLDPEKTIHPNLGKPVGKNAVSIQKSFRTSDIDEVGDETHLTFFEMLGNFSFGGYFKEKAIEYAYEFITSPDWMDLKIDYVSIFSGDPEVPADTESEKIWKSLGVKDIRKFGREDNFWGPTGAEGPCGPTTEIYVKNALGQSVEIWNIVFNEYYMHPDKRLEKLKTPGVDTGMGLERLAMVSQETGNIFATDLFEPLFVRMPADLPEKKKRILADHARASAFLIADGVRPSNKEAGYVLRRLLRRIIAYGTGAEEALFVAVLENYNLSYLELDLSVVMDVFNDEKQKFDRTLEMGLRELNKLEKIDAKTAFKLYESFGLPYETIKEVGAEKADSLKREEFDEEFAKHQEVSRSGQEKKFGGHGLILNTGELKAGNEEEMNKVLRLHTTTHLLQRALREVLGPEVKQMGSDITPERTRFDFAFSRKLTPEEVKKAESLVNEKVKEDLPVNFVELSREEAEKTGALFFFKEKYPARVKVYYVGKDLESAWSKEFCGGPHVKRTGEIGKVRIIKEEAVGAGTRRIRATVE